MSRLNQKVAPARMPEDTGHCAYADRADPAPWQPGWQLPPTPATGPEVDAILIAACQARIKKHLEELASLGGADELVE